MRTATARLNWKLVWIAVAAFAAAGCATAFAPASAASEQSVATSGGTTGAETSQETDDTWRTVAAGEQAAIRVPVARQISDPGSWIDAWAAIHANKSDPPPRPDIDFLKETALVILLGQRPTGGYGVSVVDAQLTEGRAVVEIDVTEPAADSVVTQALTSPYLILAIAGPDRQVELTGDDITTGYVGE